MVSLKIKFKIATVDRFSWRFTNNKEKTVVLVSITRKKGISTRRLRRGEKNVFNVSTKHKILLSCK